MGADDKLRAIRTPIRQDVTLYFSGRLACRLHGYLARTDCRKEDFLEMSSTLQMPDVPCFDRDRRSERGWAQENEGSSAAQEWIHPFTYFPPKVAVLIYGGFRFMDRGLATGIARSVRPIAIYLRTSDEESRDWLGVDVARHAACDARAMHVIDLEIAEVDVDDRELAEVVRSLKEIPVMSECLS